MRVCDDAMPSLGIFGPDELRAAKRVVLDLLAGEIVLSVLDFLPRFLREAGITGEPAKMALGFTDIFVREAHLAANPPKLGKKAKTAHTHR